MRSLALLSIFLLLSSANGLSSKLHTKLHGIQGPVKAIYIDWENINWNAPEQTVLAASDAGFNVIILAFYLSTGVTDMGQAWQGVPDATKQATMSTLHERGQIALISFGGSTDSPYGDDPNQLGQTVASWAVANYLDGVDFDLENFNQDFTAGSMNAQQTVAWVAAISNAARNVLGSGRYVTHAPQAPYFGAVGDSNSWAGATGGYTGVYNSASIDWFNTQFYNQGPDCYVDYNGLFTDSCGDFPGTSVVEISKYGIPLNKLVVGKPVQPGEAGNGYVDPNDLRDWFENAQDSLGWNAGVMGWEWATSSTLNQWIGTIYPNNTMI